VVNACRNWMCKLSLRQECATYGLWAKCGLQELKICPENLKAPIFCFASFLESRTFECVRCDKTYQLWPLFMPKFFWLTKFTIKKLLLRERVLYVKALRNWKIFVKALLKRLRKLTIKMKQLWQSKFFCFVNFND